HARLCRPELSGGGLGAAGRPVCVCAGAGPNSYLCSTVHVAHAHRMRICAEGSCPGHQAGKATEASSDFRWRGGRLMTSRRILPPRKAVNLAAMISICQLIAKRVRGLSSLKQRCAKLTRSRRKSARCSSGVGISSDRSFTTEGTEGTERASVEFCRLLRVLR